MEEVFISYGREDQAVAKRLYTELRAGGAQVWLDTECLLPGQKWKSAIRAAIKRCRYFLFVISTSSVGRRGFINTELLEALEILAEFPDDHIYLIPVRVDDCSPTHDRLKEIQYVDLFPEWDTGIVRLRTALNLKMVEHRAEEVGGTHDIEAFILVNTPSNSADFANAIAQMDGVREVRTVFGSWDILASVSFRLYEDFLRLATKLQALHPRILTQTILTANKLPQTKPK